MNTKLSGAQLVLVPIQRVGVNKFPFVENIRTRYIKYVDFCPATYLPNVTDTGTTSSDDMYLTLFDEFGNTKLHNNMPLQRFDYTQTLGNRLPVLAKLSLDDCYVECRNAAMVGTTAAFVFWYDLPEYSSRNTTDHVVTDSITIPLTTAIRYNQLPDEDRMANKRFRRILASAPSVTPDYQTGITLAQMENIYLTLCKGSYVVAENLPLMLLYQMQTLWKSEFANIIFDFQSSYLTIGGAGTIPNVNTAYVGKSVFLNMQYEK